MSGDVRTSFISTLDHLPCDLIRSLWVIQSLNLLIQENVTKYDTALVDYVNRRKLNTNGNGSNGSAINGTGSKQTDLDNINKLNEIKNAINFYQKESIKEANILKKLVTNHKYFLNNEIQELNYLNEVKNLNHDEEKEKISKYYEDLSKSFKITLKIPESKKMLLKKINKIAKKRSRKEKERELANSVIRKTRSSVPPPDEEEIKQAELPKIRLKLSRNRGGDNMESEGEMADGVLEDREDEAGEEKEEKREKVKLQPSRKLSRRSMRREKAKVKKKSKIREIPEETEDGWEEEEADTEKYCLCKDTSYGEMIACDNKKCKIEWFHYKCVNLKKTPVGKWYCPDCDPLFNKSSKPSTKNAKDMKKDTKKPVIKSGRMGKRGKYNKKKSRMVKEIPKVKASRINPRNKMREQTKIPEVMGDFKVRKRGRPRINPIKEKIMNIKKMKRVSSSSIQNERTKSLRHTKKIKYTR